MKFLIANLVSLFSITLLAKEVNSKVDQVTIYLNQAEVHRVAKTSIDANTTELVFNNLSNQLDQNSIQVKGKGDFIILGTSYRYNYLSGEQSSEVIQDLRTQIESKNELISDLASMLSVLSAEEDLLKSNKVIGGGESHITADELKSMAEYYRERLLAINKERYRAKKSKKAAELGLNKLQNQLNQETSKEQKVSGEIVVEISNSKLQQVALELTYLVRGASWNPSYDLRANTSLDDMELIYKASVTQNTGEKWENVDLTLSTNNPSYGSSVPKLNPWYLDFMREAQFRNKQASMRSAALMSSEPMMEMSEDAVDIYEMVTVNEGLLAVNYQIDVPTTILSGSKPTLVPVRSEKIKADFVYQTVPKVSEKVYLVAKTEDWKSLNLIPGYMNVFYDGGFVNKTYINPSQNMNELNVSFGVDQSVTAKHQTIFDYTDDQNIGSKRRVDFKYSLSVHNNKSKAISLEVFDQLPVSQNDDIEVNNIEVSGGVVNKSNGEIKWTFDLDEGKKKAWEFGYQVRYPQGTKVNGL
ncbi:MAG: DUF4139 domain-containing protein [Cyclobacteriaceae bacterium]